MSANSGLVLVNSELSTTVDQVSHYLGSTPVILGWWFSTVAVFRGVELIQVLKYFLVESKRSINQPVLAESSEVS